MVLTQCKESVKRKPRSIWSVNRRSIAVRLKRMELSTPPIRPRELCLITISTSSRSRKSRSSSMTNSRKDSKRIEEDLPRCLRRNRRRSANSKYRVALQLKSE